MVMFKSMMLISDGNWLAPIPGFTRKDLAILDNEDLTPGCLVTSDGLGCFAGVIDADYQHTITARVT